LKLNLDPVWIRELLKEDAPFGDPSLEVLEDGVENSAEILAKEDGIFCGEEIIRQIFLFLSSAFKISVLVSDGDPVKKGDTIAQISGDTKLLLQGERIILNIISYLSGISTETSKFVEVASPYGVKILDTRKTLPLYRELSKYAVRMGGGFNHRYSLSDLIMLKDNHITGAGGIEKAFEKLLERNKNPFLKIEVEVKNVKEALAALKYSPDIMMLDNFSLEAAKEAIYFLRDKVLVEISGGITLSNLEEYTKLKPDFISVGSLTHHVKGLDMSMKIKHEASDNECL
jgi:nicotinate-nucleotide pyrophosphorylase (carboxylating)